MFNAILITVSHLVSFTSRTFYIGHIAKQTNYENQEV